MELYKIKPYTFNSVAEVFDLHLSQLLFYLHRMTFSGEDYIRQAVPLNIGSTWRTALSISFNWSVILALSLANFPDTFPQLRSFNIILAQSLQLEKITFFSGTCLGVIIICEYASLYSLWSQLKYRNTKLDVIYDFKSKFDR